MSSKTHSHAMSKTSRRSSIRSCMQSSYDSMTDHSIYRWDNGMQADSCMETSVAGF